MYKSLTYFLNKLAYKRKHFDLLVDRILHLQCDIKTEECLTECVNIFHKKAIDEPQFVELYGNMAVYMTEVSAIVIKI